MVPAIVFGCYCGDLGLMMSYLLDAVGSHFFGHDLQLGFTFSSE
jgi:hypothetical protein